MKKLPIETFILLALMVCMFMGLAFFATTLFRLNTREAPQAVQVQPASEETTNDRGMRIDPLSRFTSPGSCVGSICF